MADYKVVTGKLSADPSRKVLKIKVSLEINNSEGDINITDLMLQGGPFTTSWQKNLNEMRWDNE